MSEENIMSARTIGNYYGSLDIKEENGNFYRGIENYDGTYRSPIEKETYIAIKKQIELDSKMDVAGRE